MFSQTAEYALRAVVWLADRQETSPVGVQRIAEGTHVPRSYLSKVLRELTRAGLVSGRRGAGGGYRLNREPDAITVLDVINSVDPIERIERCPLGLKSHRGRLCGMHARLDKALSLVQETLQRSTIADILETRARPHPMKESAAITLVPSVDLH